MIGSPKAPLIVVFPSSSGNRTYRPRRDETGPPLASKEPTSDRPDPAQREELDRRGELSEQVRFVLPGRADSG
ncbi:bromodomain containing 2 [Isosphaera pallida ATCC 43644]|jgi:hypothetical protein|uniref:Bromodomain containing 2 n=1 Tax=Isosphaera pallida (strain ATCC 43644 / DSM 9630 / IS1B) TaxID=575540 RepID=E8QXX3_ISOPI|nr:bromodomain containing 2 [Isosphaera pallida ATCC 43644]